MQLHCLRVCLCAVAILTPPVLHGAKTLHTIEPDSGIESWELRTRGVSLRLTQILPDQLRAFYTARGFDVASVELLATGACAFQTIFRNESVKAAIEFNLIDWRSITTKGERPLKLEHDWQQEWEQRTVASAARTAFRYALYPTQHRYETGDWNMGMTTIIAAPGSRFDLRFVWHEGNERREARLCDLRCAKEMSP